MKDREIDYQYIGTFYIYFKNRDTNFPEPIEGKAIKYKRYRKFWVIETKEKTFKKERIFLDKFGYVEISFDGKFTEDDQDYLEANIKWIDQDIEKKKRKKLYLKTLLQDYFYQISFSFIKDMEEE